MGLGGMKGAWFSRLQWTEKEAGLVCKRQQKVENGSGKPS